jgi:thiamine biosynthesis lipoprotein
MKLNFLIIFSLIFLFSCKPHREAKLIKFAGEAQGTYYAVTYFDAKGRNFQNDIDSLLKDFDQTASMWVENSIISKINRNEPDVVVDEVFTALFEMSKDVYVKSEGAFDPTIGPLVNAWGFGYTDRMKVDQHVVDSLLPFIGFDKVRIEGYKIIKSNPHIQFDFNAIAQGYSVDLAGEFLEEKGIQNYLIDIGGEVLGKGKKPGGELWKLGIEKPSDNAEYGEGLKAIVHLENRAMATSGNYRKFYEEDGIRYSHTIDPKTGYPVQHSLLSVSVLADDCATADAWATAFMISGLENSKELLHKIKGLEAYFIYSGQNGELQTYYTNGFQQILVEEID